MFFFQARTAEAGDADDDGDLFTIVRKLERGDVDMGVLGDKGANGDVGSRPPVHANNGDTGNGVNGEGEAKDNGEDSNKTISKNAEAAPSEDVASDETYEGEVLQRLPAPAEWEREILEMPLSAGKAVGRRTHRTPQRYRDTDAIQTLAVLASGGGQKAKGSKRGGKQAGGRKANGDATKRAGDPKADAQGAHNEDNGGDATEIDAVEQHDKDEHDADEDADGGQTQQHRKRKRKLFEPKRAEIDDSVFESLRVLCEASLFAQQEPDAVSKGTNSKSRKTKQTKTKTATAAGTGAKAKRKSSAKAKDGGGAQSAKDQGGSAGAGKGAKQLKGDKSTSAGDGSTATVLNLPRSGARRRKPVKGALKGSIPGKLSSIAEKVDRDRVNYWRHFPHYCAQRKFLHCLTPAVRRWCAYEWFYGAIDAPWFFNKSEISQFLEYAGIAGPPGSSVRLTRREWSMVRGAMGKPRRLSKAFLRQERDSLEMHRQRARASYVAHMKHQKDREPMPSIPADVPPPLMVGQRVLARHPKVDKMVADGCILTVRQGNQKFRVQFSEQELGSALVEDINIMAVPDEVFTEAYAASAAAATAAAAAMAQGRSWGPLFQQHQQQQQQQYQEFASVHPHTKHAAAPLAKALGASAYGQTNAALVGSRGGVQAGVQMDLQVPMNKLDPRYLMAEQALLHKQLSKVLDKKHDLVRRLARMNLQVERGQVQKEEQTGTYPEDFRVQYAKTVAELPTVNHNIQQLLINMQYKRPLVMKAMEMQADIMHVNHDMAIAHRQSQHFQQQQQQQQQQQLEVQQLRSAPVLLQTPSEVLSNSRIKAKHMVDSFFAENSTVRSGGRDKAAWEIGRGIAGLGGLDQLGAPSQPVKELIVSCMTAFIAVQVYADHTVASADVNELMDAIHEMLKPRAVANSGFFHILGGVLNDVAALIQQPAAYA